MFNASLNGQAYSLIATHKKIRTELNHQLVASRHEQSAELESMLHYFVYFHLIIKWLLLDYEIKVSTGLHDSKVIYFLPNAQIRNPWKTSYIQLLQIVLSKI